MDNSEVQQSTHSPGSQLGRDIKLGYGVDRDLEKTGVTLRGPVVSLLFTLCLIGRSCETCFSRLLQIASLLLLSLECKRET